MTLSKTFRGDYSDSSCLLNAFNGFERITVETARNVITVRPVTTAYKENC